MHLQKLNQLLYPVLLAVSTLVIHLTYLNNGFTWLDHIDLEDKQAIVPLSGTPSLFVRTYSQTSFYRPIISLFHSLDYAVYGNWAPGYHFSNLLIHCAVVIACYYCILALEVGTVKTAFFGSLLIAVHPANVYSIGLISYRTDPLAVLAMLGAYISAAYYFHTLQKKYLVLCSGLFFLGVLAKETVVFWFPAITVLLYYYYQKDFRKNFILAGTIFATACLYLLIRSAVVGKLWVYHGVSLTFYKALGTRMDSLSTLLVYFFSPTVPTISDAIRITGPTFQAMILPAVATVVVLWLIIRYRSNRTVVLLIGMVLISIIPALNLVALPRFVSPHYLYFTTVTGAIAAAYVLSSIRDRINKSVVYGVLVIWASVAAYNSFRFGNRFTDDLTLFLPEVNRYPQFLEGAYYVGRHYYNHKNYHESEVYFRKSVTFNNGYLAYVDKSAAMNNLAIVLMQNNKPAEAEKYFEEVVQQGTGNRSSAIYNLALTKLALNKPREAIALLEKNILESKGGSVETYVLLAKAYAGNGEKDKARALLQEVEPLAKTTAEKKLWEETVKLLP